MTVLFICALVLAALGWLTAWMSADQVAGLRDERDEADHENRNLIAANRILDAACDLWQKRAAAAEQQAADNELACLLFHGELERERVAPVVAPVVALPGKRGRS